MGLQRNRHNWSTLAHIYSESESESGFVQFCPTLCYPMDCSLSGSSVHGIFQARLLEWIAISFSRGSSQPRNWTQVSHTAGRFFTVWATRQAHLIICWWTLRLLPCLGYCSVQFSHSVVSDSLWPHESQHAKPPCQITFTSGFPSSTALVASFKFWYIVFSFSFTLKYFLIYVITFFDPSVI